MSPQIVQPVKTPGQRGIAPGQRIIEHEVGVCKHIGVEQSWPGGTKEPVIVSKDGGERAQGGGGVGVELRWGYVRASGGLEDLGGSGGVEGVV